MIDPKKRIFGTPGVSLDTAGFGDKQMNAGQKGEEKVANLLDGLTRQIPNLYVFHSVKLPGHKGDMDHVVFLGGDIFIIDTKNWWDRADFSVISENNERAIITRNGRQFAGGEVRLPGQWREWQGFFPAFRVFPVLCLANTSANISHPSNTFSFVNMNGLRALLCSHPRTQVGQSEYTLQTMLGMLQYEPVDTSDIFGKSIAKKNKGIPTRKQDFRFPAFAVAWVILNLVLQVVQPIGIIGIILGILYDARKLEKKSPYPGIYKFCLIFQAVIGSLVLLFHILTGFAMF